MLQENVLGVEATKEILGPVPLQMLAVFEVVIEGIGFTVTAILLVLTTGFAEPQSGVKATLTTALFCRVEVGYVLIEVFPPTFTPLTLHWYKGLLPPSMAVAVKVTDSPEQIVLSASLDEIETLGVH
jgi:hypothetical protein